jgi:hypothetical protein
MMMMKRGRQLGVGFAGAKEPFGGMGGGDVAAKLFSFALPLP